MPESGRLPELTRDDLDTPQRELYDVFVNGPRQRQASFFAVADTEGVLSGPYRAMLLSPSVGSPMERLGRAIRFESCLPDRLREIAILTVACVNDCALEWNAHEGMALASGIPEQTVMSLRGSQPVFLDDTDALVHRFVRELLIDHRVDDETFGAVEQGWGRDGVFELIACAGYYQLIAHLNNGFGLGVATGSST